MQRDDHAESGCFPREDRLRAAGKMGGEHLVCSPCGEVAGRERLSAVGLGPEVLLSLLPLANLTLYRCH